MNFSSRKIFLKQKFSSEHNLKSYKLPYQVRRIACVMDGFEAAVLNDAAFC